MEDFDELDNFIIDYLTISIEVLKKRGPNKLYKAEELCINFWGKFNGLHPVIGKRIKSLSKNKKIPIESAGRTSCNKQLYRLL